MSIKQEIMNSQIGGNAHSDRNIFGRVHNYVVDTNNSVTDRADLLEWMETKVMGCSSSRTTDLEYVESYLRELH